ncbi:hypothetical protein MQE36_12450 [Zhouia spongiae]|uniref:XRE family transcriptional regulator n=1 Tax=Zhouia spongiae TaxID=2202721 RepID=A0ABY3YJR7_9FLAO|nr:hypothetical protein [Zhouia spongiae]UNY97892.1 hypothetical protein MQE36_12450 [Zhouia spongiae]
MIEKVDILHYTTSIEMVLKELREEKGISQGRPKGLSQSDVNIEFAQKYKVTLNMGRMESNPNFGMIKLLLLCDYFEISITDFFERVLSKEKKEIVEFLRTKKTKKRQKQKKDK